MDTSSLDIEQVSNGGRSTSVQPTEPKTEPRSAEGLLGLSSLIATQKPLLFVTVLGAFAASALGLAPFLCIAEIARHLLAAPTGDASLMRLVGLAAAAIFVRYALLSIANVCAHTAAYRILYDLRLRLAAKLGKVPLSFFSRYDSGQLKRTLLDDVQQIEGFVAHHLPEGISAIAVPVLVAALLFGVDYRMALASIAVAPLAVLVMVVSMHGIEDLHRSWLTRQDGINQNVLEFFRGMQVVKAYGLTAQSFGKLRALLQENTQFISDLMRRNGGAYALFQTLLGSSWLVLVPLGGYYHLTGTLSLPRLVLFLIVGPQLLASATGVIFAWESMKKINEGIARIHRLLSEPELPELPAQTQVAKHAGLEFVDVSFEYEPGRRSLENVSFSAEAGSVTALVGPSGSGKTSLARLAARLWDATTGSVKLGGVDIRELPLARVLEQVALVFQDVFLFRGTVRENLLLANPGASEAELLGACRTARAHDFICALPHGYDTELGERGARLSGGEKQRLSIARALLKNSPILILDEATAFTDAENEAAIAQALHTLCSGRTVLIIAHRLATVAHADLIVVMNRGRVVDRGRHPELLQRCSLYARLWAEQCQAADWHLDVPSQVVP